MLFVKGVNIKNIKILEHYRYLIENNLFDEYDILGFLIFIREQIDNSYCHSISEFADLIAHRNRNKGKVQECIHNAIMNHYKSDKKGRIKEYHGINMETWKNEWDKISVDFNIKIDKLTLKEITVCICSLAQDTKYYEDDDKQIGIIELFIDGSNYFSLCTSEGNTDSIMICFLKEYKFNIINPPEYGCLFDDAVETKRENGILKLYYKNNIVFEVK